MIQITGIEEKLKFYTKWDIQLLEEGGVEAVQSVEVSELGQTLRHALKFSPLSQSEFDVQIENEIFGRAEGKGKVEGATISWSFHCPDRGLEGEETFKIENHDRYSQRAQYSSPDSVSTLIQGSIWKKIEDVS